MSLGTAPDEYALTPRPSGGGSEKSYYDRWLKTWVVLLVLVVLVVVAYLVAITNSLAGINKNLGVASAAVTGAGGHVLTLPDQVELVNKNLTGIDAALQPIPGQGNQIVAALGSINNRLGLVEGSLTSTSGSLVNTSGSLVNTSSSLVSTSNMLVSVLNLAGSIDSTLASADNPPDRLGVTNIYQRVAVANSILAPARHDTSNILATLVRINVHLQSICNSVAVHGGPNCNS